MMMTSDHAPLHALDRVALGPGPGDVARVTGLGVERYVAEQLHPESLPVPETLGRRLGQLHTFRMDPVALFREYQLPVIQAKGDREAQREARLRARVILEEAIAARLWRALESPAQLQEVMTAFWFNHFNVFAGKGVDHLWIGAYEEQAIRPHVLGRFRQLLGATAKHPAMLFYLDNWQNTRPRSPGRRGQFTGLNENYARELMELHTLGVDGGYSQADVVALARILTGWGFEVRGAAGGGPARRLAAPDAAGFVFDPRRHDVGGKVFLGATIAGGGMAEGERALDMLARHPSTARFIAQKLVRSFVADEPPAPLVTRLAERFVATDGDIRAVLATLLASEEFWDEGAYGAKFKTPYEYVVSAARATGVSVLNVRPLVGTMAQLGMPLYGCPTPNGYKDTREAWLNPDAMMMRLSFATALGAGRLPLDRPPNERPAARAMAAMAGGRGVDPQGPERVLAPPDPGALAATLGPRLGAATRAAVEASPNPLHAALMLGSPEFMTR
jgi:uncharacterized protein (DUF1800 family)